MTSKRRRKGEGGLFERTDASGKVIGWGGVLDLGWVDGKRSRRWFRGKTQREVLDRMREAQHQSGLGTLPPAGRRSLGQWLERWLADVAKPTVRPSTYRGYELAVRHEILPALGKITMDRLTVADVRGFLNSRQGLSPRTVYGLRAVLRRALNVAIKDGLIPSGRNVAALAEPPKVPRVTMKAFTPEQAQKFLASVKGDPLAAVYTVSLTTGMRQGEVLGLMWRNVDLEAGTLRIDKAVQRVGKEYRVVEPKSETSRRLIHLPQMTVEALRAHKERQQDTARREGAIRSLEWRDLVFRTDTGRPLNGTWVNHRFQAATKAAGLPKLRYHDLRHSCASLLGALGVPPRVVMELLGHSSINLTLNTYSHVFATAQREAAVAMDAALAAGGSENLAG
jgi:integrase